MFGDDDAEEDGRPVADKPDEVFEVVEEILRGFDGDWDDDHGDDNGVEVPRDAAQTGGKVLEIEGDGVDSAGAVAEECQGEDDDDEFAEAAGGAEHGCEDASNQGLLVALCQRGRIWCRAADRCAEYHEEGARDPESKIGV